MDIPALIQYLSLLALPLIFAITAHEAAHGWMAYRLGDRTAKALGRVTFNPLKHIDPVGTIAVPIGIALLSSFGGTPFLFGWAKPVPVDGRNLHNPRRDMALVAIAGPAANLLMAIAWGLTIHVGLALIESWPWFGVPLVYMGALGVVLNVVLMLINLLPLLPLDGGRIISALLPSRWRYHFARLEPYGFIILLILLFTGILGLLLHPLISGVVAVMPGASIVHRLLLS